MIVSLNINPNLAIARERVYQDYIHECQMLLIEVLKMGEILATYLIQKEQHWFPAHINIKISTTYDKRFKENLTLTKNCVLWKSLAYIPISSRVTLNSNYTNMTRIGISTKGQVISIVTSIDPTNFKEIGTKNYWINNSVNIWNRLTFLLGLKMEIGYTPTKMVLIRLYKNTLLTKFLRKFEIDFRNKY
jgi:hypothetical protein